MLRTVIGFGLLLVFAASCAVASDDVATSFSDDGRDPTSVDSSSPEVADESDGEEAGERRDSRDGDPDPDLDTELMPAAIRSVIRTSDYDGEYADLDACPFNAVASLDMALDGVAGVGGLDHPELQDVLIAELFPTVIDGGAGQPAQIDCGRFPDDIELITAGISVSEAPRDLERYVDEFYGNWDAIYEIEWQTSSSHRGGTLERFCVDGTADEFPFYNCEVVWVDDEVMVTLWLSDDAPFEISMERLEDGLVAALPGIVDDLSN